jgi:hypothetical protein
MQWDCCVALDFIGIDCFCHPHLKINLIFPPLYVHHMSWMRDTAHMPIPQYGQMFEGMWVFNEQLGMLYTMPIRR